jgi:hypothetical protein
MGMGAAGKEFGREQGSEMERMAGLTAGAAFGLAVGRGLLGRLDEVGRGGLGRISWTFADLTERANMHLSGQEG